ncbi:MAG: ATP-binding protein, partial [Bacteroidales bacterium]|nr:ATP-binding protein [Bacteroidales bacterium]
MKLKKLRIQNFRGYQDVTINFNDFNCIVGKNDVGKSTIFKALEKFFDYRSDIDLNDYNGIIPENKDVIYALDGCPI